MKSYTRPDDEGLAAAAQAHYQAAPAIRAEFGNLETYRAYLRGVHNGRIKGRADDEAVLAPLRA